MRGGRVDRRIAVAGALAVVLALTVVCASAAAAATRRPTFKPRIGFAMGLLPAHGAQEVASSPSIPVLYHGGSVMRNVTIHTVFWAPAGYHFDGSPGPGVLGYEALIQQFFADVAHDSGSTGNIFSLLNQFGDHSGDGGYQIHYDPAVDSVADTDPYPAATQQCPSPSGVATCVTDLQVQKELDKLIGAAGPAARGLTNVYFVLLPPDVDECIMIGSCGTTAFAGYHSAFSLGHGLTVYSAIPDPQIEFTPPPGSDPEGNAEAEETIDTAAHEAVEAITDPVGTGWMDPNGLETADKCENGPQQGTPLGYASDGSPYQPGHRRSPVPHPGHLVQRPQRLRAELHDRRLDPGTAHGQPAAVQLVGERHPRQRAPGAGGRHPRPRRRPGGGRVRRQPRRWELGSADAARSWRSAPRRRR